MALRMRDGGAGSADAPRWARKPNPALHLTPPCSLFTAAPHVLVSLGSNPGRAGELYVRSATRYPKGRSA
ncbi:hypothetical protein C1280_01895 [Gemmata obscuriglobus]|uniref:Uncharacterized protein n=1 Tax=Gemmata obscuriglobus TaxID=114 RepID=A0A2Z3GYF6_9BACT|nr:hypothetical protein C1280_01895 [Gemmata obscuriglobus]